MSTGHNGGDTNRTITRRGFVKTSLAGVLSVPLIPRLVGSNPRVRLHGVDEPSDVVIVHDSLASQGSAIQPDVARIMIDEGIKALTGESTVGDAWLSIFPGLESNHVIGIKVNTISSFLPTHREVVYPLIDSMRQMIVGESPLAENNFIIWDRTNSELMSAGYTINTGTEGVRCFGTNQSGVGYTPTTYNVHGVTQQFSRIFDEMTDHNINLGVTKNHGTAGATFCMKNHYGTVNNMGYTMHLNYCNPYIPALNQVIRDDFDNKDRLMIVDAIFGAHYGGPGGPPTFIRNEVIMTKDPVAADTVGTWILEDYGCPTLGQAQYIATAAEPPYSLGNHDPELINVIRVDEPSTGVRGLEESIVPARAKLHPNYPNPFNPSTTIPFSLHRPSRIRLEIYSSDGRLVKVLLAKELGAGDYDVVWDGKNQAGSLAASGVYFCRLSGLDILETRSITLMK